jgi:RHS repeat-associated protein
MTYLSMHNTLDGAISGTFTGCTGYLGAGREELNTLNYFGARYYDGDLGLWTSVDAMRQFWSPYGYVGNGWNPVTAVDADGNYVLGKTGSGDKTRYAIHTRSRAGVAAGQIIKTGAVVTTMFFYWGVGVAWGLVTGVIEAGGDGAQKGAITGTATSVMSEGFDSGKLVGKVGGTFLTAAGEIIAWDETMSQADSPEFIEEFERRMIGNGGDTYNSFITEQEATDFANEIRKTIGEDEQ